jgi:hypothetical protein
MKRRQRTGRRRWHLAATAAPIIGYAVLHRLGRTYGATHEEQGANLPGDDIVPEPQFVVTHAITINAPPEQVWPWLLQMGWHRGGWYTARWVDRLLFPVNAPSAYTIVDELQDLAVGDFIPDGPPESECGFMVEELEPGHHLLLHSTSHLPLEWRRQGKASVDWTWAFVLEKVGDLRTTRLVFRWRAVLHPWWLVAATWSLIVPADFIMSKDMLHGIKARVESSPADHNPPHPAAEEVTG